MEVHLVHYNSKYGNFQTAMTKNDGLAVIAFFVQALGNIECHLFAKITDHIQSIRELKSKYALDSGKLNVFLRNFLIFLTCSLEESVCQYNLKKFESFFI